MDDGSFKVIGNRGVRARRFRDSKMVSFGWVVSSTVLVDGE